MKKTQLVLCISLFLIIFLIAPLNAQTEETIWYGKLAVPGGELSIVFHVNKSADNKITATMDSPDQGAKGIGVSKVEMAGDSVRFEVAVAAGFYSGKFTSDSTISGKWHQSGMEFPLALKRVEKIPEVARPQEPKKPYPYNEIEVNFENKSAGIKLAGTLTEPKTNGPFPAVVLITGSGAQDRNETIFNHKPFLVIADYLTRRGIAVLRYDDRGVGGSGGKLSQSTSEDLAGDVLAAIDFLKSRKEIDTQKIGLIGHSEGGIIAPMVAAKSKDVAFIVLLAGTGVSGEEILVIQAAAMLKAAGISDELIEKNRVRQKKLFSIIKANPDDSLALAKMKEFMQKSLAEFTDQEKALIGLSEKKLDMQLKPLLSRWFRFFLTYDPKQALRKVTCPVLALNGEKDLQVPPDANLPEIEKALQKAGNTDVTIKKLPGLNHLFQPAQTGLVQEYGKIETTFSPEVLKIIGDWIGKRVGE
ncbi:MAG: alpha/beta fold hydrolase [Calditrichaeota bacterium]|nr:alpha/beta fold hydrolase [Calditrichota bacterium]